MLFLGERERERFASGVYRSPGYPVTKGKARAAAGLSRYLKMQLKPGGGGV